MKTSSASTLRPRDRLGKTRDSDLHTAFEEEHQISQTSDPEDNEQMHCGIPSDVDTSVPTYGITELFNLDDGDYFFLNV
jgi:hypothetical protein